MESKRVGANVKKIISKIRISIIYKLSHFQQPIH